MKKIILGSVFGLALILIGCSTYQYSARQVNVNRQNIKTTPTIVDVKPDYSKRIEVTSGWCLTAEEAVDECRYNAITENQIDVIVDPIWKVKNRPLRIKRRHKATVIGYAGYYVNSRTVYEDMKTLREFSREDIEKYLIIHNPEVLQYMSNTHGEVVNIYHNDGNTRKENVKPTNSTEKAPTVTEKKESTAKKAQPAKKKTSKSKSSKSKSKK